VVHEVRTKASEVQEADAHQWELQKTFHSQSPFNISIMLLHVYLLRRMMKAFQLGPGQVVMIEQLKNGCLIDEALGGNSLLLEFYHCNWAEIRGTIYKTGCYLVASLDENCSMPVFVCVHNILARNQGEDILFFCEKLSTISFLDLKAHLKTKEDDLRQKGLRLQPRVVVICEDLSDIGSPNCVVFAVITSELNSIMSAVDSCSKACFVFNIHFHHNRPGFSCKEPCTTYVRLMT
jgi:hypothetical protein